MSRRLGILAMLGAVLIYGSNFAITRHATLNGLAPVDLVALRFGLAGLILLPYFIRAGVSTCAGIGWRRGILLAIMSGVPMTLLMNSGLALAPAAHGAAIGPGTVTVIGVVGSYVLFRVVPTRGAVTGILIVLAGLTCIAVAGTRSGSPDIVVGDLLFFATGVLWGLYPLLLQRWNVGAMTSTAIVAVLSLAYLPIYAAFLPSQIAAAEPWTVAFHAVNQGIVNVIAGLWLWGYGVKSLGAAMAQRFPPLIPVVGTLSAIPIVGEWPGPFQALGACLIVGGLAFAALSDVLFGRRRAPSKADALTRP